MDPKAIIRAIAVALLAGSALACAIEVGRLGPGDTSHRSASDHSDPSAAELLRCTKLAARALNDAACQAAWAKNRQHFFGTARARSKDRADLSPSLHKTLPTKAQPKTELDRALSAPLPNTATAPGAAQQGR